MLRLFPLLGRLQRCYLSTDNDSHATARQHRAQALGHLCVKAGKYLPTIFHHRHLAAESMGYACALHTYHSTADYHEFRRKFGQAQKFIARYSKVQRPAHGAVQVVSRRQLSSALQHAATYLRPLPCRQKLYASPYTTIPAPIDISAPFRNEANSMPTI